MIVVSDTTPLNYLILIDAAQVLPAIFGRVYAPPEVVAELQRSRRPELEPVRRWASSPPKWLIVRKPAEIDQSLPAKLGRGEVQAISLAKEIAADKTLLDDWDARQAAKERGLEVVGTLGVLEEAAKRGLIDIEEMIKDLKETTFRASEQLYQSVRDRVREHEQIYPSKAKVPKRRTKKKQEQERDDPEIER
jgi:predicted nucleic acid-binding protein